jgi:hypothetical protein
MSLGNAPLLFTVDTVLGTVALGGDVALPALSAAVPKWTKYTVDLTAAVAEGFFDAPRLEMTIVDNVPALTMPLAVVVDQPEALAGPAAADLGALTYSIGYRDGGGLHAAAGIYPLNSFTTPADFSIINPVPGILIPNPSSKIVLVLELTDADAVEDYTLTDGQLDIWLLTAVLPAEVG